MGHYCAAKQLVLLKNPCGFASASAMKLKSLLDVILSSRSGDITVLNRIIYVGTVESGKTTQDIEAYHRKVATLSGLFEDQMRGVLLHFANDVILHLLEGPSHAVRDYMEQVRSDVAKPLVHESIKILLSTEDIDNYCFPMWACKPLNLPRPDGDMDKKDAIAPHVFRTYMGLLEMGKDLSTKEGAGVTEALDDMRSTYHEKLPGNELVGSCIKNVYTTPLDDFANIF